MRCSSEVEKGMENSRFVNCPFYNKKMDADECYDRFLIASRLFKDDNLVKEADRDNLYNCCLKCKNYDL